MNQPAATLPVRPRTNSRHGRHVFELVPMDLRIATNAVGEIVGSDDHGRSGWIPSSATFCIGK